MKSASEIACRGNFKFGKMVPQCQTAEQIECARRYQQLLINVENRIDSAPAIVRCLKAVEIGRNVAQSAIPLVLPWKREGWKPGDGSEFV